MNLVFHISEDGSEITVYPLQKKDKQVQVEPWTEKVELFTITETQTDDFLIHRVTKMHPDALQPAQKKAQREPHLYSADHAVILGLANTLRATAEHHKMSSIKQGVCEGEVEYYF